MNKVNFEDFEKIMSYDIIKAQREGLDGSIEIEFDVDGSDIYYSSWMGKLIDRKTNREVYWFGLVKGGEQSYDYEIFEDFINDKVFYGEKSLREIWNLISIINLDGASLEEMLDKYI